MAGIRMASPWKDPRTGMLYLRVRVPPDLQSIAVGRKVSLSVAGGNHIVTIGKTLVKLSLRTRDPIEAKARFIVALAALQDFWGVLRRGPERLTHKQRIALAGAVRQYVLGVYDDDPGAPDMWRGVIHVNERVAAGPVMVAAGEEASQGHLSEVRYGKALDVVLTGQTIILHPDDRAPLIAAVAGAMQDAAQVNLRKAEGDYSPDAGAARYPALQVPHRGTSGSAANGRWTFARAIDDNVKRRGMGRDAVPLRPATVAKLRRVTTAFVAFRGNDDLTTLTTREVNAWIVKMQEAGDVTNKTINDRVGSLKMIVGYAIALTSKEILGGVNPVSGALDV